MNILFEWRNAIASDTGPASSITRLVLLVLSLPMTPQGGNCFLSVRKIAEKTGLSVQTVVTHIHFAVKDGWLTKRLKGFTGKGWRHHEYEPSFPEGAQRGGTASDINSVQGAQADGTRRAEGVQSDRVNVFKEVEPNTYNIIRPSKINTFKGCVSGETPIPPPCDSPLPLQSKKASKHRKSRATALPAEFTLTDAMRDFATSKGFSGDVEGLFESFCDYWRGIGKRHVDWTAVWRNWVRNEIKFKGERKSGLQRKGSGAGSCPAAPAGKYDGIGTTLVNE